MAVVIDANLLVALAAGERQGPGVERQLARWTEAGEELHAPTLFPYELASALARLVASGRLETDELPEAWATIQGIPVELHAPADLLAVVRVALQLGRASAYDAAYLALAVRLRAELWTLDGPLARNAGSLGFPVRLVE